MSNSTNLSLPFLTLGQAQKHVTINETLLRLDALVQLAVISATTTAEPGSPSDGQVYILPAGKTGTHWTAMANNALAYYRDGVWEQITPHEGFVAYVKDVDQLRTYNGSSWTAIAASVTFAATDKVLGRVSSGGGAAEEVTFTDQAQQLCDDTSFGAMRTTLAAAGTGDANVFSAKQTVQGASFTLNTNATGDTTLTRTMLGLELIAGAITATNRYTPPVKFMSTDAQLTTENPKLLAAISGRATQTYNDDGDGGMALDFFTTPNDPGASSVPTLRVSIEAGLVVGAPTGGDKGAGAVNATAVYDDNTLLTCFVLEYARTGALDLEFWDSAAPRGYHAAAHRFWGQRELLDVSAYTAYWKEYGHLPGLPSREEWAEHARDKKPVGEMISRLWQTVEMQAVHIAQLSDDIKALRA